MIRDRLDSISERAFKTNTIYRKSMILPMVFLAMMCMTGADSEVEPSWDTTLPSVELENVRVEARSVQMAWKRIATDYLLRTILYLPVETGRDPVPFAFSSQRCTAADVFNAFVSTYPDMTWTPDAKTGVIWFYPRSIPYSTILATKVRLGSDMLGVPMQTGILEPIGKLDPFVLRVKRWGTSFTNTFNYTVNAHAGVYTVRDLLNTCCKTQIGTTFYIRTYMRNSKNVESITAASLYPDPDNDDELDFPRAGARHWWATTIGALEQSGPREDEVIDKLASSDHRERSAARIYFEATTWRTPVEKWMKEIEDPHKALWVTLAFAETFLKSEQATYVPKRMKKETTESFLMTADPALAFLTALQLSRLERDGRYLDILSRRNFAPGDLAGVVADANRICRQSPEVRQKLTDLGMGWLTSVEPRLAGLASAQPKCEFELVKPSFPAPKSGASPDKQSRNGPAGK